MSMWELPTSLNVNGRKWTIRSDFRAVLDILKYFSDKEYELDEKWEICLDILYEDYENMPNSDKEEAARKAVEFIDMGIGKKDSKRPSVMDWEKDATLIIPAVNEVLGKEIRLESHMHWWTFLSAYMQVGDGLFAQVVSIRSKMSKGKKLDDFEKEFLRENKDLIQLNKEKQTRSEEEKRALDELFGVKGR